MSDNVIDFKKRSTGEVSAPELCARCGGTEEDHSIRRHHAFLPKRVCADDLVEKLATSVERAAVVKFLRALALRQRDVTREAFANHIADDIVRGEHCK